MSRGKHSLALLFALAAFTTCELAHAEEGAEKPAAAAPPYTLEVDSDAPSVISYDAMAARLSSDLGADVARASGTAPSRAAIVIRYRDADRQATVRATHGDARVVERTVKVEGDAAAVQREVILLAGNLARDEARELLDALAAKRPPEGPKNDAKKPEAKEKKPIVDEGFVPVGFGLFYPLATNFGKPNARTYFDLSIVYGRMGRIEGLQIGGGAVHATRAVEGAQIAPFTLTDGDVEGAQISGSAAVTTGKMTGFAAGGAGTYADEVEGVAIGGAVAIAAKSASAGLVGGAATYAGGNVEGFTAAGAANVVDGNVEGFAAGGAANVATGSFDGLALAGAANVTGGSFRGAAISTVNYAGSADGLQLGVINVAGGKVNGLQLGVVNVAEEVDGAAIGVVSISKNSIHPVAWSSNLAYLNAGVRFSTKYVYTAAAVSIGTNEIAVDKGVGGTLALGVHIPIVAGFDADVEGAISSVNDVTSSEGKDMNSFVHPRILPGYTFAKHLRVFAGGGARIPVHVEIGRDVVRPEFTAGVSF